MMSEIKNLPSIDGKPLTKPKSKSTERHERESLSQFAEKLQISAATVRRALYIDEYGSEVIKAALLSNKISIWRAYGITKREENKKVWAAIQAFKKVKQP